MKMKRCARGPEAGGCIGCVVPCAVAVAIGGIGFLAGVSLLAEAIWRLAVR